MRLICPNCAAQYEVGDDVIPTNGRDVQCSNCAHTWFETPGASEAREAEQSAPPALASIDAKVTDAAPLEAADIDTSSIVDDVASDVVPSQNEPPETNQTVDETPPQAEAQVEDADTDMPAVRRPLSPSVAEILREEAAREEARRITDTSLETQPDLGLDSPRDPADQVAQEARDRMARLKGEAAPAAIAAAAATTVAAARSDMLPDIEEINSSLRSEDERSQAAEGRPQTKRKSGFRRGFFTVLLIAVVALLIYMFAPQISAAVPALEPTLTTYVNTVNDARLWLDLTLQGFLPGGTSTQS